jgi:hypothetical protein
METQMTGTQNEKRGGGNKGIVIVALVVIAVLVGVIVYLLMPKEEEEEKRNRLITPDNVDEVIEEMTSEETTPPGYYTVSMNNVWNFADGSSPSENAHVANRVDNENDVYFDLFVAGDEENPIYESPVIPRGSVLEGIALDTPLEAGTYDCVMVYHIIDDEQNTLSTLRVKVTLIIES